MLRIGRWWWDRLRHIGDHEGRSGGARLVVRGWRFAGECLGRILGFRLGCFGSGGIWIPWRACRFLGSVLVKGVSVVGWWRPWNIEGHKRWYVWVRKQRWTRSRQKRCSVGLCTNRLGGTRMGKKAGLDKFHCQVLWIGWIRKGGKLLD